MIAYAEYYTDARIRAYVHTLLNKGISVDLVCLYDRYSKNVFVNGASLSITFIGVKYQGDNILRYLTSYFTFFVAATFVVSKMYIRERYHAIHVHNQPDFLVFCTLIPKIFGAAIILDMHDIMIAAVFTKFSGFKRKLLYFATKLQTLISVKYSDTVICADHSQMDYLQESGIAHPNMAIIMNLPDDKIFYRRKDVSRNPPIRLVYHGTLTYRLGLDLAIEATEKASKIVPLTLTIIGNGEQKETLILTCRRKGILDSLIFFKDFIPVEMLQQEIEQYDIGILANRKTLIGDRCMLPVKLMEYLAVGLPVVAPSLNVIQRYFNESMVSYFEPENVENMAQRIIELARDSSLRERQVLNADGFFKKYSWSDQQHKYIGIIQEM